MNDNDATQMVSLETDMAEIESMIGNARRAIVGGDTLDLSSLGDRIVALCEGVRGMALTTNDPEALQRRLGTMVSELQQLETLINANAQQNGLDIAGSESPSTNDEEGA